ncbi:AAA family ATPase [Vibrio alginolyticus]|uniref:AAA family ATPase n=1 Tax=Vibrio alginolyticus TaxID=663 RepID=UPI001EF01F65|nr:AAA family ATPase [Vibrio alginolyticus]EMC8460721.1 AAA family ATPase [Vibrio alginolyticus]EME3934698.1 AAA family ATPase [Vibrio alginolyticus]ULF93930.1 AAA family ATPase [Vibrio alginolyticus]
MINGISKIKSLRSFGIYENHINDGCDEFSKFNLIYGWNGSGKSTLSRLFRCIENKSLDGTNYTESAFEIEYSLDGQATNVLTQQNLSQNQLNIRTFNNDFVRENIDWSGTVKSILLVDQQKIEERKQLDEQNKALKLKETESEKDAKLASELDTTINRFLSKTAKSIKTSLKVIGTEDSKYLNYNKTSLENLIKANSAEVVDPDSVLNDEQIISHTKSASPVEKDKISYTANVIKQDYFNSGFEALSKLMSKSAVNEVIDFLRDNPDVQTWVSTGMALREEHQSDECHFCGSKIDESRLTSLNNHFSNEFKLLKQEIADATKYCLDLPELTLPGVESFFDEFQAEYKEAVKPLGAVVDDINKIVDNWRQCLAKKSNDPFDVSQKIEPVNVELIDKYNKVILDISDCVKKHNDKSGNFKAVTTQHKKALELHYAADEIIEFDYSKKVKDRKAANDSVLKLSGEITKIKEEIQRLEAELSNESIAVDAFNAELAKFIGRTELTLKFDAKQKGYRISRNGSDKQAQNLSEGEKTAIAFVYFATKLEEHDNDIKDTIVVIDDPVSSFDSNHLFHSYSFLKKHCEQSKQLFVMTHNFSYFKLVRDWMLKKNKMRRQPPVIKAKAYTIESKCEGVRQSKLVNAGGSLTDYNSEYHYLFFKLYSLKDKAELNLDEVYLCANLSRKLLESFLCFKFPKKRSDFRQLVDDGVRHYPAIKPEDVEKVYRFINKYSHNQEIELEDNADNLLGESPAILNIILEMIKTIDEAHYTEMEAVVTA